MVEGINLYTELGLSDEEAHGIYEEFGVIVGDGSSLTEIIGRIPEGYDRKSIVMGVFLGELILGNTGRLMPSFGEKP